jgi:hypothetical protein
MTFAVRRPNRGDLVPRIQHAVLSAARCTHRFRRSETRDRYRAHEEGAALVDDCALAFEQHAVLERRRARVAAASRPRTPCAAANAPRRVVRVAARARGRTARSRRRSRPAPLTERVRLLSVAPVSRTMLCRKKNQSSPARRHAISLQLPQERSAVDAGEVRWHQTWSAARQPNASRSRRRRAQMREQCCAAVHRAGFSRSCAPHRWRRQEKCITFARLSACGPRICGLRHAGSAGSFSRCLSALPRLRGMSESQPVSISGPQHADLAPIGNGVRAFARRRTGVPHRAPAGVVAAPGAQRRQSRLSAYGSRTPRTITSMRARPIPEDTRRALEATTTAISFSNTATTR